MGFYEDRILPTLLDIAMRQKPFMKQREKVVPLANGRVLEVGIGSGLNLAYYDAGKVEKLWGLDPSPELREMAQDRADQAGLDVEFVGLRGEELPLDDESCDAVVITYTLCTIPDPVAAVREIRRVLKPGGAMHFSEHGRAPDASVAGWQDRLNGIWGKLAGGCTLNRDVPSLIREGGMTLDDVSTMYIPGPRPMSFNYWGSAVKG